MKYTHAHAREVIFVIRETMRPSKDNLVHEVLSGHNVKWNNLFFLLWRKERGEGQDEIFFLERIENFGRFGKFFNCEPVQFRDLNSYLG